MNILHYSLGLPPYRTGGLTKYSVDLMINEYKHKNNVILLFPGSFNYISHTKVIKSDKYFGIEVYELINPLPVPLVFGIKQPKYFYKKVDKDIYLKFLKDVKPDVIHIHTLMGIHKEFFEAANELNIATIYTSHDYFGLCFRANFINHNGEICSNPNACENCSFNSYDIKLLHLMQSKIYRKLKDSSVVKELRKYKKNSTKSKEVTSTSDSKLNISSSQEEFIKLRNYYLDIFKLINKFHFNSSTAREVFERFLHTNGEVISITHSHIKDNRKLKAYTDKEKPLRITYIGPIDVYKGFYLLIEALNELVENNTQNWHLSIFGGVIKSYDAYDKRFYRFCGKFDHKDLEKIFDDTDVLVIPSIWKETFGFIGLEALSFGVPVIITDNVGFKDIILNKNVGIIIKPNKDELINELENVINNRGILRTMNKNIMNMEFNYLIDQHTREILDFYRRTLEELN